MRRNSRFDYSNTCPLIDGQLHAIELLLYDHLKNMLEDLCPELPEAELLKNVEGWRDYIYADIEPHIEQVRKINADMRAAADEQITSLAEDLDYAQAEIADKTKEVEILDREVLSWKEDYEQLESEFKELQDEL